VDAPVIAASCDHLMLLSLFEPEIKPPNSGHSIDIPADVAVRRRCLTICYAHNAFAEATA
jgi:hypothetical protein